MEQAIECAREPSGVEPLFEEVQEPPWPFMALGLGATAAGGLALARWLSLGLRFGAAALLAGGAGLAAREFLVPMRTTVLPSEIRVHFGRRTRFRVPLKNVVSAFERRYQPLAEYGGWGIRFGRSGRAFNIQGSHGVQLVLRSGTRLLIGSQRPAELAETIRKAAGCTGEEPE